MTQTISFLLGSGFSIPEGIPGTPGVNEKLRKIQADKFYFSGMQYARFKDPSSDPNQNQGKTLSQKLFFQQFLEFYNTHILKGEDFDYEEFFDFYNTALREELKKEELKKDYSNYYPNPFGGWNDTGNLSTFDTIFQQLLADTLRSKKYYENACSKDGHHPYNEFIQLLKELLQKEYQLKVHTLNHDMFFDWLCETQRDLSEHFSDGFEIAGSPYYNYTTHKDYNYKDYVKLSRYTENYDDKRLCLFKLHGSVSYYTFYHTQGSKAYYKGDRVKHASEFIYKERYNDEKNRYELSQLNDLLVKVEPCFLTGRDVKIPNYKDDPHYKILFKYFKKNLKDSEILIVIGYGFKDEGINSHLTKHFRDKKMIIIDPKSPGDASSIHIKKSIDCVKKEEILEHIESK